jgi:RNA polymerase sigma factor (sigma-70 family)
MAYVRKALVNRFLASRRKKSAGELPLAAVYDSVEALSGQPDETAAVDERDRMWRILGELPERQRAAIVLRFFHDLPDASVADALDCQVGTVRSLISRGLSALRGSGNFADDSVGSYYLRNVR